MSDLTIEKMRDFIQKLKEFEIKDKKLKYISPVSEDMLTDEFIEMLPEGTEIIYSKYIPDIENYTIGNHELYADGLKRMKELNEMDGVDE